MTHDAYVFDLDGTIYLGDDLLPGSAETIAELRRRGTPVRFVSNNPTRSPRQYVDKLGRLGIEVDLAEVVNTVVTTVDWLREHHPQAVVFPIAEQPLVDALTAAGFEVSDDASRVDVVIASYDRGFDYRKLQVAFDTLWFHRRGILVQTNPDRYCPFPGGRGEPDCAAITAAIEACTQVPCSQNLGKPDPVMLEAALRGLDVAPGRAVMVGDRLATDIAMAKAGGLASALVLTGDSTRDEVDALPADARPDLVLDRIDALLD
ncbi:HAD-IIA family hydrolase [Aestuariimicrobium ganziense]|uniref:HAD-IIA family hydrolase n=1 Tax=Aestuariimicrobium ganziense TaxID=2773677 RepID=UPI0019431C0D|nr:HAD-IIA family hydrolase [Aestuariimicrobium ganziense]